jgi:hypothetical protein
MGNWLTFCLGILLIACAMLARRFAVGLTNRTAVSPWYGRTWLIGNGLFLLCFGASGLLSSTASVGVFGRPGLWSRTQNIFFALFGIYNGVVLAIVGSIASHYFVGQKDWKWCCFSLALVAAGAMLGYGGILSLVTGR